MIIGNKIHIGSRRKIILWSKLKQTNEPEVTAYISGLTTPLSAGQVTKLNTFVAALKTGLGITALSDAFDVMYILANETAESGLRNLVKRAHDAEAVNAPTFTALEGFTGNGTSSYIKTNYIPSSDGVRYQLNSASIGFYLQGIFGGTQAALSCIDGTSGIHNTATYDFFCGINTLSVNTVSLFVDKGLLIISRTAANVINFFKNKILSETSAEVTTGIPTIEPYILARNNNGTADRFSDDKISFAFIGRGITQAEVNTINDAFNIFFFSLNQNITYNPYATVDFNTQYKANLHTHTTESDAHTVEMTPLHMAQAYSDYGYDILAITDHDTYQNKTGRNPVWPLSDYSELEPSVETAGTNAEYYPALSLLMIQGNEFTSDPATIQHRLSLFNAMWTDAQVATGDFDTYKNDVAWTLAKVSEMGGLSIIAHPKYHLSNNAAYYANLINTISDVIGIEIFNGTTEDTDLYIWDEILLLCPTKKVFGFSNTDDHNTAVYTGKNYNIILAPELNETAIKAALQAGAFYAVVDSLGHDVARHNPIATPIINSITATSKTITITAANTSKIEWIYNKQVIAEGEVFTMPDFTELKYIRAKLTGSNGGYAYTQPFLIE